MSLASNIGGGSERARDYMVWDPLVRLVHWSLVLMILLNSTIIDEESAIHHWIGYTAAGLVVIRLVWGFVGSKYARFSAFPPNPVAAINHLKEVKRNERVVHLSHNPLGALMTYNLWATVLFLGVTGYMMGTRRFFGIGWVEEVHELAFDWLMLSVGLHLAGVIFESWRSKVSLVKSMISGRKQVPPDHRVV